MHDYNHGRFTSPDPLQASASAIRPQSWNRYSYSYNNPLRFIDPTGMIAGDVGGNAIEHEDRVFLGHSVIEREGTLSIVAEYDGQPISRKVPVGEDENGDIIKKEVISFKFEIKYDVTDENGNRVENTNKTTYLDEQGNAKTTFTFDPKTNTRTVSDQTTKANEPPTQTVREDNPVTESDVRNYRVNINVQGVETNTVFTTQTDGNTVSLRSVDNTKVNLPSRIVGGSLGPLKKPKSVYNMIKSNKSPFIR